MSKGSAIAETIGLVLILASIGWRLFITQPSVDLAQQEDFLRIEQKLNVMWHYLGEVHGRSTTVDSINAISDHANASKRFHQFDRADDWEEIANRQQMVSGIFFLLGTALVSYGRYAELSARTSTSKDKNSQK